MNKGFEIIDNDDVKIIKGISFHDEFIEIKFKNGWLNVTACKTEGGCNTSIFRQEINKDMSIDDIMKYFSVIVE